MKTERHVSATEYGLIIIQERIKEMKARISTVLVLFVSVVLLVSLMPGRAVPVVAEPHKPLKVLEFEAENVQLVGQYDTPGTALRVAVDGDYAYVADYDRGLRIIDVSEPTSPHEVGYYDMPEYLDRFLDVAVDGNYAYAIHLLRGDLFVIDISDPANPYKVGSCNIHNMDRLAVAGNYVYATGSRSGLEVIDISEPSQPIRMGSYDAHWNENPDVAVESEYVYVASADLGGGPHSLWIIDVSDPTSPYEIGRYDTGYQGYGVAVSGDYAYVVTTSLLVIDVSDPAHPQKVGEFQRMGRGRCVEVDGDYAYVCDGGQTLRVVDISDLDNLQQVGYYSKHDSDGDIRHVALDGDYIYVAAEETGLLIFRFSGCDLRQQSVLLVPGWGGSEASLADDEQLHYFQDWLGPDYSEGCNLFYARGLAAEDSLDENAMAIQRSLQEAYQTRLAIDPGFDGHFDIIAHSYGGINSRRYLESDLYEMDQKMGVHVDNLFTMGTPHGGESLPTAGAVIEIAWKHIIDWRDWGSIWQALPGQMEDFNRIHDQKEEICYRLIGGNAYEQDLPLSIMAMYSFYQHKPNDLGVRVSTAQELGKERWKDKYPNVVVATTPDIHGYTEKFGLADCRSYVHPQDTFEEYIKDYLGSSDCVSDSRYDVVSQRVSAASFDEVPAVPAVILNSEAISSGVAISGTFEIDWQGQSVIYLNWSLGELELTLTNPEGGLIDPSTVLADPNVDYFELETLGSVASYVFTDTITGTWKYTVTADTLPRPIPYQLMVIPPLPVAVTTQTSSWQRQGGVAVITATLSYSGSVPLADGQVGAQIFRPDGHTDSIDLYDDGVDSDYEAGDGIYAANYSNTDTGGFYGVLVEATGVYQTQPYTRHAETSFSVATDAASLVGHYSDQPRDTNGDGRYEWLDVGMKVSVTQVGTYTLAADLVAEDGSYIGHAMLRTGLLTGTQNLLLSFDGDDILESGRDGSYTVTSVLLVESEGASLLLDQADDVYMTATYSHLQFGSGWYLYLPVVLRNH